MELATPITIYWDLAPEEDASASLLQICTDILNVRPLMLQLYNPSPFLGEGLLAVLKQFNSQPISVTLTITPTCFLTRDDMTAGGLGIKELLLVVEHPDDLKFMTAAPSFGVACPVSEGNWQELPTIVAVCRERGIQRLVLPMQRLYGELKPFMLTKAEQKGLEKALAAVGGTSDLKLTIHDPFLWRAFNPDVPFPQGGCQAANTMIAISPDRGVYPCPTLPVRLGDLGTASLSEILSSSQKKEFRRSLLVHPADCQGCPEVSGCKGGCRGRAYVMQGSFDALDEACR